MLYAREKQGLTEAAEANIINDVFRKSKSARCQRPQSTVDTLKQTEASPVLRRRPKTAYTQSYSFVKNGLDIGQIRRDTNVRTKTEQECGEENKVKIDRLEDHRESFKKVRPKTAFELKVTPAENDESENVPLPIRPKTAFPKTNHKPEFKGLSRPHAKNISMLPCDVPTTVGLTRAPSTDNVTGDLNSISENRGNESPTQRQGDLKPSSAHSRGIETSSQAKNEIRKLYDTNFPQVGTNTTTAQLIGNVEIGGMLEHATQRTESRRDISTEEDELIALTEGDLKQLDALVVANENADGRGFTSYSRLGTPKSLGSSRSVAMPTSPDGSVLRTSSEKTQSFLTQYAKKSKVFSYVVKTRSSIMAPRERMSSHRSPCITYQELASIKASMKQHESRTRSLVQRSYKLSSYVDKLATAGEIRNKLQEMRQTGKRK